ncbi:hypothetical protein TEQG_00971 [Trichophyton equinum CBS 127.97]|uniref:AMP-activated protein kinase glycogen-binding domain-containing protein n=1 Tax=Trichophyton equinum (strain ATCC MYA-4606 / CBS 127.97) TaxID=559882 RepID=F2PJ63_TRIEC|nr:hypothetical protein TEQG_00971 [Trichophyton equinum CBS 127.97]
MGYYYTFRWPRQAQEVIVTGSFDGWARSIRLERTDAGFEKEVLLPETDERILYKFIVDGHWRTDPAALQEETDEHNNINSVLLPRHISPTSSTNMANGNNNKKNNNNNNNNRSAPTTSTISGVTPESTTAALAGAVPREPNAHQATISSAAPTSSTAQLAGQVPFEKPPGTYPESPIKDESYSVNPLPATGTLGNPVKLAPGEKLSDSAKNVSSSGLGGNVTLDKGSYDKDASDPTMAAAAAAVTGGSDKNKKQGDCGKDSQQKVSGKGEQRSSGRDEQQKFSGNDQQRFSGKDDQQRFSGKDDQQRFSGKDEQRFSGKDEQQRFSGKDEQRFSGKDEQQRLSGKDEQRFSGKDEQQKFSGNDQQRFSGKDEQQRFSGKDEQRFSGKDEQQRFSGKDEQQRFSGNDQQRFSVNPLPATGTVGNPSMVSSGEKQSGSAKNGTPKGQGSSVTTDKQSYDKGASDPAMAAMAAVAATGGNGKKKQGENGNGQQQFSVNPLPATGTVGNPVKVAAGEKLPEQSTISSNTVGSKVTTGKESYEKDASDPAMAAMAAKQHDKKNTFSALPAGSEPKSKSVGPNDNPAVSSAAPQATTAALAGAVPLEKSAGSSKNATTTGSSQQYGPEVPAKQVPERVKESMSKAHADPEAACLPEMVQEQKDLEKELLKEVSPATGSGQPAPTTSAATTSTAPAPTSTTATTTTTAPTAPAPATTPPPPPNQPQSKILSNQEPELTPETSRPNPIHQSSGNDGPVTKGTTASQVPEAPKETPQVTTGPVTTDVPETSGAPEQKAQEQKPIEPRTTATVTAGADAGTSAQEDAEGAADDMDRKKKNRISGFLYRLKEKFV